MADRGGITSAPRSAVNNTFAIHSQHVYSNKCRVDMRLRRIYVQLSLRRASSRHNGPPFIRLPPPIHYVEENTCRNYNRVMQVDEAWQRFNYLGQKPLINM